MKISLFRETCPRLCGGDSGGRQWARIDFASAP
jgi:hypothetical protein